MKVVVFALLFVLLVPGSAAALDAYVVKVVDLGSYVLMQVGPYQMLFEVAYADRAETITWLPMDECIILGDGLPHYKVVNKDQKSTVEAQLLR
jgi:hypothetical protein